MNSARRFCAAVLSNGGHVESIALHHGSIDIGWFGSAEPRRAFIHSSRDEAGSLIQLQWLEQNGVGHTPSDGAIAIVHGLKADVDAQADRRYQLYLSGRLQHAERIIAIDVRIGNGRSGDDRLVIQEDNPYSQMLPLPKIEFAVQEFGKPGFLFRNRWQAEVLASGREVIEDQLARLF
ncbi:MAG TPA: hypothetical protein VHC90_02405 [Bryobacteraceae bacterium]|nr:hypothetical protein [Bryobacteraceae bacterium]